MGFEDLTAEFLEDSGLTVRDAVSLGELFLMFHGIVHQEFYLERLNLENNSSFFFSTTGSHSP